ncbi:MAG: ABC transporter ATP-binding protein, partial [Clostridiales bacterium]|nr:ABC transporter ATP-binding protein [Clostridiales bacterium]
MGSSTLVKDFVKKHKWKYIIGIFFILCVDTLQLIFPKVVGGITDGLQRGSITKGSLLNSVIFIMLIALGVAIFRYLFRVFIMGTEKKMEFHIRKTFFDHLLTLSAPFYHKHKTGDLMAHATNDINAVRMAAGMGVLLVTDTIFLLTTTLIIMLTTIDIKLTLLALIPLPVVAIGGIWFGRVIHKKFTDVQEAFSGLTDMVQESFSGIRVIKAFVQERGELKKFNNASENAFTKNMRLARMWAFFGPLVQVIATFSLIITIGYGGTQVIYGNISLGDFMAFIIYLG